MIFDLNKKGQKIKFIEKGEGKEMLVLVHGLMGTLSNFETVVDYFSTKVRVIVPLLPLYNLRYTSVNSLQRFLHRFVSKRCDGPVHLLGNSLGGHISILQALEHPQTVKSLTLTGSSGLFESGIGDSYPRRGDYEYVKRQTEMVFYDPKVATKAIVDNAYAIVNNRVTTLKTIQLSRSAMRHNVSKDLHKISCPTLLIWGENDIVTPKFVAEDFHRLIQGSELQVLNQCGHAPMMEHPQKFNEILERFLKKHHFID